MGIVSYEVNGDVGVVRINNPPVNALSHHVRMAVVEALKKAANDASKVILISGEGRMFTAGADITEMGKPRLEPKLPEVLERIEQSTKPVLAAIHGSTMGGGVELSLCCDYRCAASTAKMGLPEVKLGLLPGAGGTQRVPRLIGVEVALDMMTGGNPMSAAKALDLGLIDRMVEGDLFEGALIFARELADSEAPTRRLRDINIDPVSIPAGLFAGWRKKVARRARGQIAPELIVDCVEAAVSMPADEGLAFERDKFVKCMQSPQSRAMRHMFFAQREAARIIGLPRDTAMREIRSAAIIGAGTMGGGIAMNFANAGIPVCLLEVSNEALDRGFEVIRKNYGITVSKGKMSPEVMVEKLALISGTTSYDDLATADMVIEAVYEDIELKKQIFIKMDQACKSGAILASNTSYQDINLIAAVTGRPEDVIGLHFFSPANVMKLLEVVRADKTADDVLATCMKMAKTIGKIPTLARVCYGFIGNRMLRFYGRQSQLCLIEGSSPWKIDKAMQNFGMAMGPFAVYDLAGLDVGYTARKALSDAEKGDPRAFCISDAIAEMGRFGQKTGAGYYKYDSETRARTEDPAVMAVVEQQAKEQGVTRCDISDEEIVQRLVYALINEGAKILEEGIAQRSGDIDVIYVFGYGFPVARGGPMHYADKVGLKKVYETICSFQATLDADQWVPAPLLKQLANEGGSFGAWEK